jgi:two-component system cell cycle sensor histidine kinase/response regulator CckA
MDDRSKTKAQLISELKRLRRKTAELEAAVADSRQSEAAHRESEATLRAIMTASPIGIGLVKDRVMQWANEAMTGIIGYGPEEYVGQSVRLLYPDDDECERAGRALYASRPKGGVGRTDATMARPDGEIYHVHLASRAVDPSDPAQGDIIALMDITQRKKAEAGLRASEEQFRELVERAQDGIIIIHQGRVVYVNPAYTRLTGYAPEDLIGGQFSRIVDPGQRDLVRDRYRRRMAGEDVPSIYEARLIRKDGRPIDVEFNAGVITYQGEPANLTTIRDITERKQAQQALEESEARFRDLAELLPESIFEMDAKGRLTFANKTAFAQFGYTPEDLAAGLNGFEMVIPEERSKARERAGRIMAGEEIGLTEYQALTKQGRAFPAFFRSTPILREGRPVGLRGFIIDITERKRVEEALRESEERYRTVLEHTGTAVSVTDENGRLAMVNSTFEELSGFSREEIEGRKSWTEFVAPEDLPRLLDYRRRRDRGESSPPQYEFVFGDRHGRRHYVVNTATRIPGTKRTVSSIMDITERKRAEAALLETQEKYHSILESSPDPMVQYDTQGRVIYVNPSFTRVFGWSLDELVGRTIDFVPEADWPETARAIERMKHGESDYGFETHRLTKDGRRLDIRLSVAGWRDRAGTPAGSVVTLRDVTERKRMEAQFQHARKMEAVGTLAGGVAHDFNNALQAISGYVQLMLMNKDEDDNDYDYLVGMDQAIQRAGGLINQLLTVSRKMESRPRPVDLGQVVVESGRLLERTIPRMIQIEIDNADDLRPVQADPAQLEQIILNLGGNARDAMPDGGRLVFRTGNLSLTEGPGRPHAEISPGQYVVLEVTDTGHGMNEETVLHIFEPFFTTKGPGRGTGLGLATVYGIVKNHGGHITCDSRVGRGTVFTIYLPAAAEAGPADESAPFEEDHVRGGSETVLLVDDERPILEIAREILGRYGYSVVTASSGEEALDIYRQKGSAIDLVILDLSMPGMGGRKCLQELSALDPEVKVIIASGYSTESLSGTTARSEARGFIGKPYSLIGLLKLVRQVLDG